MDARPSSGSIKYVLDPRVAIGSVKFGQPMPLTEEFRNGVEVQVLQGLMPPELHLASLGLRLHRDRDGVVHEVTVVEPAQIVWRDIPMLGRRFIDVVRDLRAAGIRVRTVKGVEGDAPELGIGLWADSGIVTGVTAGDPDNPSPVPSINEVLAAYGIKPLPLGEDRT